MARIFAYFIRANKIKLLYSTYDAPEKKKKLSPAGCATWNRWESINNASRLKLHRGKIMKCARTVHKWRHEKCWFARKPVCDGKKFGTKQRLRSSFNSAVTQNVFYLLFVQHYIILYKICCCLFQLMNNRSACTNVFVRILTLSKKIQVFIKFSIKNKKHFFCTC